MATISNLDVMKHKALQVRLIRKKLSRNRMDKELSRELTELKHVTEDGAVRVNKSLFTKDSVNGYMEVYTEASKYFYQTTTPWDDRGWRLLSVDMYEEFTKKFKTHTKKYRGLVTEFIDKIEQHVSAMEAVLGESFKISDYKFLSANGGIDREMLLEQFELSVEFDTVTTGDDLRASLTEVDREVIATEMDRRATEKFAKSQDHVITTLMETVGKMRDRLKNADSTFRDTLVTNLEELCDLVPKMNIAGDKKLNDMAEYCRSHLTCWDAQTLRDDPVKRADVSKKADDILKQAEGLL